MLEATREPKALPTQEQHILVIDDQDCGVFALDAATYSIGRDRSCAIVLNDASVSRQHALLLRMPVPGANRYRYRLIDGNSQGKTSTNGTIVNGEPCQSHELAKGDSIQFGKESFCTYLIISGEEAELSQYLESAEFQSIKAGTTDPKATVWLEDPIEPEQEDATTIFSKRSVPQAQASKSQGQAKKSKSQPQASQGRWKVVLGAGIVAAILAAGFWQFSQSKTQEQTAPIESGQTTNQ
ncbi:Glycogen accumulation regulator GarA [Acaryochloris thomasi RCC1774]|uniref:Glycogen accumulation regulator GarA n=2 Tax=Acaryochloris TaxID=155977 RepID=A0A2W1JBD1_9CYAN|nr:Glycogen accumulation regulator GarA [Acaryochloris thomasi RCC1774]